MWFGSASRVITLSGVNIPLSVLQPGGYVVHPDPSHSLTTLHIGVADSYVCLNCPILWKDQTPSLLPCPWPVLTHKAGKQATGEPWVEIYGYSLSHLPASTRHNTLLSPASCFGHEPMPKFHPSKHVRLRKLWTSSAGGFIPHTPLTFGASFEESFYSLSLRNSLRERQICPCVSYIC